MKPFTPARIVGGTVLAEREPIAFEATASYRGVELGAGDPPPHAVRRVVVREPHEFVRGEDHFLTVFQRSAIELAALAGTPAPQLLHAFGREGRIHALVLEHLDGVPADELLEALRGRAELLPIPVALAIADELVGLWKGLADRQLSVPFHLGIGDVVISPTGRVRALPELASERARQTVGAAAEIYVGNVAYISPEQVDGEYGARSGMFTLGLLLYELLAGGYPLGSVSERSMFGLLSELRNKDLPPVTSRRDVPAPVAAFVARATARHPDGRFGSWDQLASSLTEVRSRFEPTGRADILAALRSLPASAQPMAAPAIEPASLAGWQSLPHDGLVPVAVGVDDPRSPS